MRHPLARRCTAIFAVAILLPLALACGDRSPLEAPSRLSPTVFADESGMDEAIDPVDSHVVAGVIVTGTDSLFSTEPIVNPVTGAIGTAMEIPMDPDSGHVHTGFTSSGQSVTTTYYAQESDSADRTAEDVVRTRIIDGVATDYSASNTPVVDTPEESAEGADPLTTLPVVSSAALIDVFNPKQDPGTGPDCNADPTACGGGGGNADQGLRMFEPAGTAHANLRRSVHRPDQNTVDVEIDADIVPDAADARNDGRNGRGKVKARHRYRRDTAGEWRLERLDVDGDIEEEQGRRVMHRTVRYDILRLHRNARRDAERRKAMRESADTAVHFVQLAGSNALPPSSLHSTSTASAVPTGAASSLNTECDEQYGTSGGRPDVVFVHGGFVSACVWGRMTQWFDAEIDGGRFGRRFRRSTDSQARFYTQRDQLIGPLIAAGVQEPLLVGHSNGGIISRLVADSLRRAGRRVLGVVEINSPNAGVPLLSKVPLLAATARAALGAFKAKCDRSIVRGCGIAIGLLGADGQISKYEALANTPMAVDITPGSSFLAELGSRSAQESFNTFTIVSRPTKKYIWMRAYGDSKCYPDSNCGGRRKYSSTKRFVRHLKKTAIIGGITTGVFALTSALTGGSTSVVFAKLASWSGKATIKAGTLLGAIEVFDRVYAFLITSSPSGRHDGLVPESSQRYSRAVVEHLILRADSHGGSPASPLVRDELRTTVGEALNTPRP